MSRPEDLSPPGVGQRLATGRTAEVYAWQQGTVLKLFFAHVPAGIVDHEYHNAESLRNSGLATPAPIQTLRIGERYGIVYAHVPGCTMLEAFRRHPWQMPSLARRLADLHRSIHACAARPNLVGQKQRLATKITQAPDFPAALRNRLLAELEDMPDADKLCHGDFHPGNVICDGHHPLVVIDWADATRGHPLADVARTVVLLEGAIVSGHIRGRLAVWSLRLFLALYLRRYFAADSARRSELMRWRPLVAAARLSEGIEAEREWLIAQASSAYP